jgi:predicted alpha/beta-hydrolase family hydrolase
VTTGGPPLGVLLAPGAGAGRDQAQLVAVDRAATGLGAVVVRMDFPYRMAGRRAPDRAPVLIASVVAAADAVGAGPLVLGGRSMGGRICSMAVAERRVPRAVGLALISYPLHPPGKPERARTEHFPELDLPCLFVSGTRDAFGAPAELEAATSAIPGPVTHHWVEGKDHGLRNSDAAVATAVRAWLAALWPEHLQVTAGG